MNIEPLESSEVIKKESVNAETDSNDVTESSCQLTYAEIVKKERYPSPAIMKKIKTNITDNREQRKKIRLKKEKDLNKGSGDNGIDFLIDCP